MASCGDGGGFGSRHGAVEDSKTTLSPSTTAQYLKSSMMLPISGEASGNFLVDIRSFAQTQS